MDREVDQILMNVSRTSNGIVNAALFSVGMSFKLITFLARMTKKGLVSSGLMDKFKSFNAKTAGEYTCYNIPLTQEKAEFMNKLGELNLQLDKEKNPINAAKIRNEIKNIEKEIPELNQLKKLGIEHCVLPKINGSNQTLQVAVSNNDTQKFKHWYLNHLQSGMNGGKKNIETIKVFTEGNYTILNMPFEEKKELRDMFKDFDKMGINYAKCPDLKVGDGYTQVAIPNSDRGLVEDWFKLWKDKQLREGKDVEKDMYAMDGNSYAATGEVTADQYINSADEIYKEANAEFEMNSKEVPFAPKMKHENSPEFVKLLQDNNYEKITINKETLVENLETSNMDSLMKKAQEQGYFVSRIPGTWGANQEALVLPINQVFTTDEDKTYVAFLHKGEKCLIANKNGDVLGRTFEETKQSYDKVNRSLNKVKDLAQGKSLEKGVTVAKEVANVLPAPMKP